MTLEKHVTQLAEDTLAAFVEIEKVAKIKSDGIHGVDAGSFASNNTFTGTEAEKTLKAINKENRDGYEQLIREPAVARLVIENEDRQRKTVYVSRKASVSLQPPLVLASYQAPMGRLASLPVGDSTIVMDRTWTVIESTKLQPAKSGGEWDSKDNRFDHESWGQQTIASLRALLKSIDGKAADDFEAMLSGDETEDVIRQGLIHQIRHSMGLRDQPILDKFQDEIFRLDLNSKLMIMGPPGTGKTTTLIKRLSQKRDNEFLNGDEKKFSVHDQSGRAHGESWIMFTPTDLLKLYLKEAFSREGVPTSDAKISTWDYHRHYLARNVLGLLQSGDNKGKFIVKNNVHYVNDSVLSNPIRWYEDFSLFHESRLVKQLQDGVANLTSLQSYTHSKLVSDIKNILESSKTSWITDLLSKLMSLEDEIKKTVKELVESSDNQLKATASVQYKINKNFLFDLAKFIDNLSLKEEDDDEDTIFDGEDESDIEVTGSSSQTTTKQAFDVYKKVIRALARSKYQKSRLSKNGYTQNVIDWLGDRLPTDQELLDIGQKAAIHNSLNRFVNTYRRYIRDIPNSYKAFRKTATIDSQYYGEIPNDGRNISTFELDAVVLLTLVNTRKLLKERNIATSQDGKAPSILESISSSFYNQVFVDEATDFSVLQLAAMKNLTSLDAESFFACGDLNQRITGIGIRSVDQLYWFAQDIRIRTINAVYRQSHTLNRIASKLLEITGGDISVRGEIPAGSSHNGVAPVLLENAGDLSSISSWLSMRIKEIESFIHPLPTTAILVKDDDVAQRLAEALNSDLEESNLRVDACIGGRTIGEGNNIRIFSIEHIKGLEFEAVFFVGADEIAQKHPKLFEKYLYVGLTRAATYLGLTCASTLFDPLISIKKEFQGSWK